jgi:uncharacterized protein YheU (UPF0270 family)
MLIPYDALEVDTLTRLIEDFVTRDGTDNGDDTPLETRVLRVRQALTKASVRLKSSANFLRGLLALNPLIDLRAVHVDLLRGLDAKAHAGAVH